MRGPDSGSVMLRSRSDGGFYLFPNFEPQREVLLARSITTAPGLCERILQEAGAGMLPGSAFGRREHELRARLAYVDLDRAAALVGAESHPLDQPLPAQLIEDPCGAALRAVRLIREWMTA